jgi:heterotetrameric sarcosine oxidase alpha subunit
MSHASQAAPLARDADGAGESRPRAGQPARLASGGLVDRTSTLHFTFDGRSLAGHPGDTLASALIANGVRLVGRSFKYHRPRGIFTAGPEEPNALVEIGTGARRTPNTKATTVELFDGLQAVSQNRWPSLRVDALAINQLGGAFLAAGFYYKTFMWPAAFWEKVYEPLIRRAAGLGRASGLADPDLYEKSHAFCDVLVIGSGPAGLAAALAAGRAGARVILCEDDFALGGKLLAERREIDGRPGAHWARAAEAELAAMPEVTILRRCQVFGTYDDGVYGALERVADHVAAPRPGPPRQRLWRIVARACVNAMGAVERSIAFGGNDRPGVMTASAVRTYVNRFGVAPGRAVAVFTATDDGWRTAADLAAAGIGVAAVIDPRSGVAPALRASVGGARVLTGARVCDVRGGADGVRALEILHDGRRERIAADTLAVSGGWNPQVALATHKGAKPRWSEALQSFVPDALPQGMRVAGAANGEMTLAACLAAGAARGEEAAAACGFTAAPAPAPRADDEPCGLVALWHVAESRSKAFVDLQNDVTAADVDLAHREGFRSVEHLKRYTTLGMATDQGKTSNVLGHAMMAALTAGGTDTVDMGRVGTTMARPPHLPVAIGAFAGHHRGKHFKPTRLSAAQVWAEGAGATFVETGLWLRAQWYPRPGETDWLASVSREVRTVREAVGFCDVSTLGKIDIQGADAGAFLDRVYVNTVSTLPVGKARYGLMLREDGFALDDGTTARLGPEHYLMSTTTANAARVIQHLEFCHQVLWPDLDVAMVSVTEQWSQFSVAGPRARDVMARLFGASDVSDASLPYMGCRATRLGGAPARVFRLSFSGELAYEIAVPARFGAALAEALAEAVAAHGGCPYGTEALGVMRIEKGHVAGNELNGQTTGRDLGLGRMMSKKKDYVGRVMAERPALVAPERPSLVGVRPVDPSQRLRAGSHFLRLGAEASVGNDEGYLTSVAFSPSLRTWIGLGFLASGPDRLGERIRAYDPVRGGDVVVEVVSPVFIDPEGSRLHG